MVIKYDNNPVCVYSENVQKLIDRGWAQNNLMSNYSNGYSQTTEDDVQETRLEVTGQQQVRRGTTHTIFVDTKKWQPVSEAFVRLTMGDFGDVIGEFEGRTNQVMNLSFSGRLHKDLMIWSTFCLCGCKRC